MNQQRIATLTLNPTIDKSTALQNVEPERKLRCEHPRFEPGGGGVNVSRAIAILGGESKALYAAGGHSGARLRQLLGEEGLPHGPIEIEDETRENLIVFEHSSTRQYRFGMPGPELRPKEVDAILEAVQGIETDYFVASGSLPRGVKPSFYADLADIAAKKDWRFVLDASGEGLSEAFGHGLYCIKPNMNELCQLMGCQPEDEYAIQEATQKLVKEGKTQVVLLSLGAGGAVLATADEYRHIPSPTVPIRSKVGAGDSTVAGFVLHLARGGDLLEAACHGVAAGAAAVMTEGSELCRRDDVERLYKHLCESTGLCAG